ncbi:hypothetical protein [Aquiflexum lacus]|uniref:hypothetical protein n=1 Tax=Aquiflexum lacus TaxID=2483805 RepID=UPI00189415C5|nr:hypothetical protein [Aquiflexum lacus]
MKKKLIAIWTMMLAFGIIPMSCDLFCRDSCGCGSPIPMREFSIKDLTIGDLVIGTSAFNPDLFYAKDQYFKVIEISGFEYLTENQDFKFSFHFFNSVYACSPAPNISFQHIAELKIINKKETVLSESNLILEAQDISEKFLISNYPSIDGQAIISLLEEEQKFYLGESFFLKWNESITGETELIFDIFIKLSDGQEFLFADEVMKIK